MSEFRYSPSQWVPFRDEKVLRIKTHMDAGKTCVLIMPNAADIEPLWNRGY
ncbi:MAG: hypothetical protein R6X19_08075 [Kiritimatiellia bacterium]